MKFVTFRKTFNKYKKKKLQENSSLASTFYNVSALLLNEVPINHKCLLTDEMSKLNNSELSKIKHCGTHQTYSHLSESFQFK